MRFPRRTQGDSFSLRRGDLVEVRPLAEILGTLDAEGTLDGMPFMPEMARFAGCRFRVRRHAHKTCVEGCGVRRLPRAVFLEGVRCDGSAHDGCQRQCSIFWKTAWLRPVTDPNAAETAELPLDHSAPLELPTRRDGRYFCQSTQLLQATSPLPRCDLRHFIEDLWFGEIAIGPLFAMLGRMVYNKLRYWRGREPSGQLLGQAGTTSAGSLGLGPGEWVEVKSCDEIESTLNAAGKNRGLSFEPEMLDHCGGRYPVAFPIRKIIAEETGQMVQLSSTVVLEGVACLGRCAKNCPRSNHFYWREAWLRRSQRPEDLSRNVAGPLPAVLESRGSGVDSREPSGP